MAAYTAVSGRIWPKFVLIQVFYACRIIVLLNCKFKKDRINSNREKVGTPILHPQWQLIQVAINDPILQNSRLFPFIITQQVSNCVYGRVNAGSVPQTDFLSNTLKNILRA